MTDGRFDYLEDGQIVPTVALWQQRLKEDPAAALSVFRTLYRTAKVENVLAQRLRDEGERSLALLDRLLGGTAAAMGRIPRPDGFFTAPQDRAEALRQLGLFITASEAWVTELQLELLTLAAVEDGLRDRRRRALKAEEHLRIGGQVAKTEAAADVAGEVASLLQSLLEENRRTEGIASGILTLQGEIGRLCREQWPAFCVQSANAADMAKDGQDCRPSEVLRVCEEWKNALQACRKQVEDVRVTYLI